MRRPSIEDAFLRFQRTGEPEALAEVFDGTAAELLRVASHLTHDLHDAEDLVQTTFLVAIEERRAFVPKSTVIAWLLGILVNRARLQRRATQRSADPERLARVEQPGPHATAEAGELSQAVSDAIVSLPEPYRPVLTLHLRHRLHAREIALALGRPAGTVRTQVMRGLELLRRALPQGLAVGLAAAMTPAVGLAAIRAAVIERAATLAPRALVLGAAGTFTFLGVLLMKKTLLATVVAVAVLASLWIAWPRDVAQPVARSQHDAVAALETALPSSGEARAEAAISETPTQRVLASAPSTPGPGLLRGRCVDEQRRAVAGAKVEVRVYPVLAADIDRARKLSVPPQTTITAADGSFRVALEPAGFPYATTIEAAGRVKVEGAVGRIGPGERIDLGAVVLETGCVITGRVVDRRGAPLDETLVSLEWTGRQGDESRRLHPPGYLGTASKNGGVLEFPEAAPSGTLLVKWMVKGTGFWAKGPDLVIATGQQDAVLEIVCDALDDLPSIAGVVVDEQGAPIEAAAVSCKPAVGRGGSTRTAVDGRFRVVASEACAGSTLALQVEKQGIETLVTPSDHHFGDAGVTLVVKRLPSVEVVAVEQGTGKAVEEFAVRLFPDPLCYGGTGRANLRARGHHPEGRVALTVSRRGRHLLVVEPLGAALAPSRFMVVQVGDQPQTWRVEVPRMTERRLLVRRSDGRPLAGTKVQLLAPTREVDVHELTRVIPADELTRMASAGVGPEGPHFGTRLAEFAEAVLVLAGETDANGELVLRAGARSDFALKLLGPGHLPVFVPRIDLAADGPLCITVETGATVTGRLEPAQVVRRLGAKLRFIAAADPEKQVPDAPETEPEKGFPIRDDGSFVCEDIPAGDWKVYLTFRHSRERRVVPIGVVERLRSGETRTLNAAVHQFEPGSLHGLVLLDGTRHRGARVELRCGPRPDEASLMIGGRLHAPGSSGMLLTADGQGAFEAELFPGVYRLSLLSRDGEGNEQRLVCATEVTVPPGGRVEQPFALRRARVKMRILDVTTELPVAGREFFMECSASEALMARQLTTDASGYLVIDPAPLEQFFLSTWPVELATPELRKELLSRDPHAGERVRIRLGPFTVPGDQNEVAFELRLPAPR